MSFSAWRIISFVMRGVGVGDGDGDGVGDGDAAGVWANTSNGSLEAATPAIPNAGSALTKFRRSTLAPDFLTLRWLVFFFIAFTRSEERRVGKECRSLWSP